MSTQFYTTTPIYYVNANPHMGHAYTSIVADVMCRWAKMKGQGAWMLTGTDEHGLKVYEAAVARGLSPQAHVDETHLRFKVLLERVGVAYDDFIRTTEPRHKEVVSAVLAMLWERGDIYAADYEGWYSKSAERFWTEKDLKDGKCPDTGGPVEWVTEKNYFFRMAKYGDQLRAWIADHPDFLQPESRKNEVLGYLRKDLGDLCISRPATRLPWGIPLPFDPDYVTYVWFDALLNYLSAIGYHPDPARCAPDFAEKWPAALQLVGKDIVIFHAVYWSTMLFAMGLTPPKTLWVHGWWTVGGIKMSKSLGNVIDPFLLCEAYGADQVRYFLLRELPFGGDGEFSHPAFMTRVNADLANDLGNLAHRALSMTEKWLGGVVPALDAPTEADAALSALAASTAARFRAEMDALGFSRAFDALWELIRAGNKYIDSQEPWRLNREGKMERLAGVMRRCLEICRVASRLLAPVLPNKMAELSAKLALPPATHLDGIDRLDGLSTGAALTLGEPLFPRLLELPAAVQEVLTRVAAEAAEEKKPMSEPVETPAAEAAAFVPDPLPEAIEIDAFGKVALRAGKVVAAERHPKADRLLVLKVDIGEAEPRTIVSGIAAHYSPEDMLGRTIVVVANLKPVKLRGILSQGMLLAAGGAEVKALVTLTADVPPGTVVR
jgi:methionyl-tRNA synthetase